ncbi:deoxyribodipyrimidine photo-lyase [Deinococcus lacus]|uniref:Deoxyribodipyrimidine photo-lyase n=1 Tax=Deinococcus lacus TaxID=392561 RepID=A0ABW1YD97_9DEIO
MVQVVWFKKDLRLRDHAPLHGAAARGEVLPLYIYEPEQLGHEEFAGHHLRYLNDCLHELDGSLGRLGAPLVIRRGEATEVFENLRAELEAAGKALSAIWAHEETGNMVSFRRDLRVHAWAAARQVAFAELPQNGVIRRLRSRGRGGEDSWAEQWEERLGGHPLPAPAALRGAAALVRGAGSRRTGGRP